MYSLATIKTLHEKSPNKSIDVMYDIAFKFENTMLVNESVKIVQPSFKTLAFKI